MSNNLNLVDPVRLAQIAKTIDFALGKYSSSLSLYQIKIHALSLAQIKNDEDPEENKTYKLNINQFAELLNISNKQSLIENLERAVDNFFDDEQNSLKLIFKDGDNIIRTNVFQSIITNTKTKTIEVRYSYDFRKAIINMKSKYDIIYPVDTILSFKCKYSIFLYNFLLAKIAIQKQENSYTNEFVIEASTEELLDTIQFEANTNIIGKFNNQAILPAVKDLNLHSELYIKDDKPEYIKEGRKTVGYIFRVIVKTTLSVPLFANKNEKFIGGELPPKEYILAKIKEFNVFENYLTYLDKENNMQKAWSNYLYTLLAGVKHSDRAKYFNKAYKDNYAKDKDLKAMFKELFNNYPSFEDEVTSSIMLSYQDKEQKEKTKKAKANKPLPEYSSDEELERRREVGIEKLKKLKKMFTK